ncbi:MAG: hypothetical protein HYT42_01760 [Candidatus Sungbacteria bacterium]|nr:hypothetical protein [Candidatus Sungbacteria bacterium]
MSDHHIVLAEPQGYSPKALATLRKIGRVYGWSDGMKVGISKKTDVLVVKLGMRVSKGALDHFPNLKVVATSTTGLNHIDTSEAKRRGIRVISLRGETKFLRNIAPTAEETIGLMIALMRNLPWAFEALKRGEWRRERFYGRELNGRILGIVGLGRLGSMVARYGRAFGMRVIACDPHISARAMARAGVRKVPMDEVFRRSDVVSVHVLLTPNTYHLVKRRHFRLMKPTTYYINTARGELNDEKALLAALRGKWIAGAALDVLTNENPQGSHIRKHPLVAYARKHANLLIMPHLGGASFDAMARTEEFIAEKVASLLVKNRNNGARARGSNVKKTT